VRLQAVFEDVADLLGQLDGRQVEVGGESVTLRTADATTVSKQMSWRQVAQ